MNNKKCIYADKTDNGAFMVKLIVEVLTDGSIVHNVELVVNETDLSIPRKEFENSSCTSRRQAEAYYKRLLKELNKLF